MQICQMEVIQMTNQFCNQLTHEGMVIEAFCLNPKCQESVTLCSKCAIKNHPLCRSQLKDLESVPIELMELRQLSLDIMILQQQINQKFTELLGQIVQILMPITKYQDQPNLNNLNGIGLLLKKDMKQDLLLSIEITKNLIKQLLDNNTSTKEFKQKQEQQQQQKEPVEPKEDVNNLYQKDILI